MKNIKLVYVDGDYTCTRINGTEEEIIEFYNFNNMTNDDINTQIKEIEMEADAERIERVHRALKQSPSNLVVPISNHDTEVHIACVRDVNVD